MSWIVETLLRNREKIRSNVDMKSDEYLDLLMVESAVASLCKLGVITEEDIILLDTLADGRSLKDAGKVIDKTGSTVGAKVGYLCNLIAFKLGGMFTDEGYLEELADTHELTEEQVEVLRSHMASKYKHMIPRSLDEE